MNISQFVIKDCGWCAIDIEENILFKVSYRLEGENYPDYLTENRIRIVDSSNKIGFANERGEIVIQPAYENVSYFNNGKAIVGKECSKDNSGLNEHEVTQCKKYSYIDKEGKLNHANYSSFEKLASKIGWFGESE